MAKKQYGLGHTRLTVPGRPDLTNKTAVVMVGDKTLEEALEEGGVSDYSDLTNKPSINGVELSGNKTSSDLGVATSQQGAKADTAYQKPQTGIPESDLSSDVQQSLQKHFKGWYNTLAELKAEHTAIEGDSAYVKDASPATTWSIYVYDSTASSDNYWADSDTNADTSNVQTFASSQEVNEVHIVNDLTTGGVDDVLSAEQGKHINDIIEGERTKLNDVTFTNGYSVNTSGDLVEHTSGRYSSPISLLRGETIECVCQYQLAGYGTGNGAAIAKVMPEGSTHAYRTMVRGNQYTLIDGKYVYSWTASADAEYVLSCNISGTVDIYKTVNGINDYVSQLQSDLAVTNSNLATLQEDVDNISQKEKDLVLSVDYTKNQGYYITPDTGTKKDNANDWISSSIPVRIGDVIQIKPQYNLGSFCVIARTDEEQTFYYPILTAGSNVLRNVPIDFDGFVVVSSTNDINFTTLKITSLSDVDYQFVKQDDLNKKNGLLETVNTEINERNNALTRYTQEYKTAINKAKFDREVMLAEVHSMTSDDVLIGGDCGYAINNNDPTDVTHGTIKWEIYKNGILYIHGYGRMYDYLKGVQECKTVAQVNAFMTDYLQTEPYGWYYGFLEQNLNGITPVAAPNGYKYRADDTDVMVYTNKRYAPNGDNINTDLQAIAQSYNKVYGYAAPWYIFRTDTDKEYQSQSIYNANNPTTIRYNRVCIEEDVSNDRGGITYIGDWAFYRCTADSLVLPDHVEKIGCWGIRYSPVMRTLVCGDLITEIEDNGISRMEAMEYVKMSNSLQTLKYETMSMNGSLRYLNIPDSVTTLPDYFCMSNLNLDYVVFKATSNNNLDTIPYKSFENCKLSVLTLQSNLKATNISDCAFYNCGAIEIRIPAAMETISGTTTFYNNKFRKVIVDSEDIAGSAWQVLSSKFGRLYENTEFVYVKSDIETIGTMINKYFTYLKNDNGYKVYIKYAYSGKITIIS